MSCENRNMDEKSHWGGKSGKQNNVYIWEFHFKTRRPYYYWGAKKVYTF